ncbi:hypothetical protein K6U54_08060, partial [Vibrio alginolyticus]|uniref:hypothetical protein n=1 Tax=Vibrio alginolyticus TaxID=663 RepID=UPI001EEB5989
MAALAETASLFFKESFLRIVILLFVIDLAQHLSPPSHKSDWASSMPVFPHIINSKLKINHDQALNFQHPTFNIQRSTSNHYTR